MGIGLRCDLEPRLEHVHKQLDSGSQTRHIGAMQRLVHIALAIVVVTLVGVTARQGLREREPVYHGKRLSAWLEAYQMHGLAGAETWQVRVAQQEADEAVRHAGTNALPTLLRMIRAKDSALVVKLVALAKRQHIVKIKHVPAEELNYQALSAFGVLRAKGRSAVPALIEIADQDISRASRCYAIAALAFIGPPANAAIPSLSGLATNADSSVRLYAVNALGGIRAEPARVLPLLINAMRDPAPQVRAAALMALRDFGPNAKPALPVLAEFVSNAQEGLERSYAANALKAIDREAAAREGVK